MGKFYALCLQGDINPAMAYLRSIQPKTEQIEKIEALYINRFFNKHNEVTLKEEDPWVRRVISAYHAYFRMVLTRPDAADDAEVKLMEALRNLIEIEIEQPAALDCIEDHLKEGFAQKGYYFWGGVTPPYRGPYIWRKMETLNFTVELPSISQPVTVHMMKDFILESWISFATCEQRTVGGWAVKESLYCNAKRYEDIEGAEFRISYLKHEAQHLYDFNQFPGLESMDLEYRAKLVELIYYSDHSVLTKFLLQAKNAPKLPHPYASYHIIRNLSALIFKKDYEPGIKQWLDQEYSLISAAAEKLLEQSTQELRKVM
ncbi:hypothetical protein BSK56_10745 [Paenibacillus borealis]|uniref:Uncharacterized protein n=1 Tax=Paenibacillus borealis TaxID=160799 RepID=A0ABX3HE16_PAEBO|nr:hypothetical protein [Paenibacillus borealis]OMD48752.1 hypothetical protein BSK56_10745 [Paenibacillus borealis]